MILKMEILDKQNKERIFNGGREKDHVSYKNTPIKISTDSGVETLKVRRAGLRSWMPAQTNVPVRLPITIDDERKSFHNQNTFQQLLCMNPTLRKGEKRKFQSEEKVNYTQEDTRNK